MLEFVMGRAGSGKTEHLRRLLAQKAREGKEKLFLLVPEQYSFASEKAMLSLCGAKFANNVRVYSFTRLAEAVFRAQGGVKGRRLSDGGRRILMSLAISSCEDLLQVYHGAAKSGRVTDLMLTAVSEMKLCGISSGDLRRSARLLGDTGLGRKLTEIALLYDHYNALVEASYLDSRDDLTRLALALETSDFFAGATVAVDSFEGFTVQELRVLGQILRRAQSVTVALCLEDRPQKGTGLFALVERTRRQLERLAEDSGVPVAAPKLLTDVPRFQNEELRVWESRLYGEEQEDPIPGPVEHIRLFQAADPYEEAEFAAASIRRLVMERGWRYRDFSIITRSPERYFGCLDVALRKRDIPCFVSQPVRVDGEPVPRLILGAFAAAESGFATDSLLELLKTGVSGFTAEETAMLENYAFLWRLKGSDWKEAFHRHPLGFGKEWNDAAQEKLEALEALRARLMGPLHAFAENTRNTTGAKIAEAVYQLLMDLGLEEHLPAYCAALEQAGEPALAQRQLRVWDLLMGILDQARSILGERSVERRRFALLLREVLAKEDVSDIPETIDQVLFGTPEQVRQAAPKAVFLLGCSQGDFPLAPKSSGVFSDAERRTLIEEMGLPLGDPLERKVLEERYLAYSVACAPSQLLVLSWSRNTGEEDREAGELVRAAKDIFPDIVIEESPSRQLLANSMEAAFTVMAADYRKKDSTAAALRALFAGEGAYAGRMEALAHSAGQRPARIEDRRLAEEFFGKDMFLSPSRIERYHSCPFSYFCRYGLDARERETADVDAMQYGTIMHYVFQTIFQEPAEVRIARSEEELLERVRQLLLEYADENLGGYELLTGRQKYFLDRLARGACRLIAHLEEELAQSRFVPAFFEERLGGPEGLPPLRIPDGQGGTVTVGGILDRADLYTAQDGTVFVRVIDYKTGTKTFRLADVLYGLNMQMLVYLAAVTQSGERAPAGLLYMPAAAPTVSVERGADAQTIEKEAEKRLRMNGLILEQSEVVQAMESGVEGRFIPVRLDKNGSLKESDSLLDRQSLSLVTGYVQELIGAMSRSLHQGDVEARPMLINQTPCTWCPYRPACGKEFGKKDEVKEKLSQPQVLARMRGEEGGGQNGQ